MVRGILASVPSHSLYWCGDYAADAIHNVISENKKSKNESGENVMTVLEGVDEELLAKVLANPEMAALLASITKTMK